MITLTHDLESIHHDLGHRLSLASTARPDGRHPRDHYVAIDTFLAAASRHDAGMVGAIAPLVRQLRTGRTSPTPTSPPAAPTRSPWRTSRPGSTAPPT